MTELERQIKKYTDDLLDQQTLARYGKRATHEKKQQWYERVLSYIDDPELNYYRLNFRNGKLDEFVLVKLISPGKTYKVVNTMIYEVAPRNRNKKFLMEEIKQIKKHFNIKGKIEIRFEVYDYRKQYTILFKSAGFKDWGYYLKGDVEHVHKKINQRKLPASAKHYELVNKFSMRTFDQMMDLEFAAHKSDKSSVVHRFTREDFNSFKPFFKMIAKHQSGFRVFYKNRPVAHMLYNPETDLKGCANVATIAVHPRHQHKGIGYLLYRASVADMKKRGVKYFFGFTGSTGVMKNAKKIGRFPISHIYLKVI